MIEASKAASDAAAPPHDEAYGPQGIASGSWCLKERRHGKQADDCRRQSCLREKRCTAGQDFHREHVRTRKGGMKEGELPSGHPGGQLACEELLQT